MLKTQEYIKSYGLDALVNNLGIHANKHPRYPGLWHFHYDQIGSPFGDPVVRECRALILNADRDWEVVAYPYNKFGNYSESFADKIDWSSARVYEKVDGTLIVMWFYDGRFNISTSGTADGGQFQDLFWKQFENQGMVLPLDERGTVGTWMFEYVSPETRIVVPHKEPHIYFHGCRNLITLQEGYPEDFADFYSWDLVKQFPLGTLEDVLAAANILSPAEQEGYVVVDKYFHRIKVKSPLYISMHHLTGHITTRALLDVARKSKHLELLTYFPQLESQVLEFQRRIDGLAAEIQKTFLSIKDSPTRKIFALSAGKYQYASVLFMLLDNRIESIRKHLAEIPIERLERML